jgi:SAM-dependent methyltransferase
MKPIPASCPACGETWSRLELAAPDFMLGIEGDFHVSRCAGCGLLFQNPRIAREDLARHYPATYAPYAPTPMTAGPAMRRELKRHRGYSHLEAPATAGPWKRFWGRYMAEARLLPDFVPGGKLLEIACASGARLSLLRELGWTDCMGIEPDERAAGRARALGFPVLAGKVEDMLARVPDGSLDAVVAGFVMEHLEDPFAVTRALAAKLKPGGQFLFSTLNVESPDFRMYGKYWYDLDLPRHHVFFRKRDIQKMLEGVFRLEGLTHLAAPNDYAGSARYRLRGLGGSRGALRFFDRMLARAGNRLLPLCLALAWLGRSSRVAVRCRVQ